MKTITVTDEQYEALKEMQQELGAQDTRSTRDPIYVILDEHTVPTSEDYSEEYEWYDSDDSEVIGDDLKLFHHILENHESTLITAYNADKDIENIITEETINANMDKVFDWFKVEVCDYNMFDFIFGKLEYINKIYLLKEESISYRQGFPVSFFEKDLFEHLKSNDYHYTSKAKTYACSLWRSPRMEELRKILINMKLGE